jgi:CBS domain-containing protein
MKARDVMTRGARTCAPGDALNCAAQIMWENDCGCVPVVDEEGRAIGMITDRDVCMAAYTQGRTLAEIAVSSAMSTNLASVQEADELEVAEELMSAHQVRRLPVLDEERRVIGVLSLSDMVRTTDGGRTDGLGAEQVTGTLAAICTPPSRDSDSVAAHAA